MDAELVIEELVRMPAVMIKHPGESKLNALKEAMKAVRKQIPKTPTFEGDGYAPDGSFVWDEWLCPNCSSRYEVDYEEHNYCPNCGQRIDWEHLNISEENNTED